MNRNEGSYFSTEVLKHKAYEKPKQFYLTPTLISIIVRLRQMTEPKMKKPLPLLRDQQMKSFIRDGYIKLIPDYPPELHEKIYREIEQMLNKNGNLGNNILPLIPDIKKIFDHPLVRGALTGVLGTSYVMHSHRFCHFNAPGSTGQDFHKDSYEGDISANNHRCRWAMAFYYPQDTPEKIGPTSILPGSQYYETHQAAQEHSELVLSGCPGTITIVHYDLWHRAMANLSSSNRYMLKFLFYRLQEPVTPTWQNEDDEWLQSEEGKSPHFKHQILHQNIWSWYRGQTASPSTVEIQTSLPDLFNQLLDDKETKRLESAYALGSIGDAAISGLVDRLADDSTGHYATLALGVSNQNAVLELITALKHPKDIVRSRAAHALGNLGANSEPAKPQLLFALNDPAPRVRRNAAESLGNIEFKSGDHSFAEQQTVALSQLLKDEHYWVRDNAARSLAKMGPKAKQAIPSLQLALNDENRYVRFNAAIALKEIDTRKSKEILFDYLFTSRWCSLTNSDSAF